MALQFETIVCDIAVKKNSLIFWEKLIVEKSQFSGFYFNRAISKEFSTILIIFVIQGARKITSSEKKFDFQEFFLTQFLV